jgi:hypothetical protein
LGSVRVGDVQSHSPNLGTVLLHHVIEITESSSTSDEVVAGIEDGESDLSAEASRGSCD